MLTGLVAYWKLDGDSNDSVGGHNGTDTSVTYSDTNGIINNGAGFDGSTSKILIPDSDDWNMGDGEFSFSMWVKRNAPGEGVFFGQCDAAGHDASISFLIEFSASDYLIAYYGTGSLITLTSPAPVIDSGWHHVVFLRRDSDIYLYLDNVLQQTTTVSDPMIDGSTSLGIGVGGDITSLFYSGAVDEVAVWKGRGLTELEITALYNSGKGLQYPFLTT